ncbi:MAG TPA: hypothetical protein VLA02_14305 [Reyranella sp.]|nr:hypothetical protein [Reyranella sp.]
MDLRAGSLRSEAPRSTPSSTRDPSLNCRLAASASANQTFAKAMGARHGIVVAREAEQHQRTGDVAADEPRIRPPGKWRSCRSADHPRILSACAACRLRPERRSVNRVSRETRHG